MLLALATTMAAGTVPAAAAIPPAVPTDVLVTAGKRAITVSWTPPVPLDDIHHYVATTSPGGRTCTALVGTNTCTIASGLTANTSYTVTVKSCPTTSNTTNCSAASVASSAVIPGPPNSPGKPTVAYTGSDGQVAVSWNAPTGLLAPASYLVTSSPAGEGLTGTCTSPVVGTSCVFSNLEAGTSYTFRVTAVGAGDTGSSVASTASNAIVAGPPETPEAPTVVRGDVDDEVVVTWSAPAGGAPPTSYTVTSDESVTVPDDCGDSPGVRSCVITVDDPTVAHTFRLTAHGGGSSAPSAASAPITPGAPGVPGTPSVELTGPGTATVTWEAPVDGSPVGHYTVTPSGGAATVPDACGDNPEILSCDITGLDPAQSYTFTVTAHSASNATAVSDASVAVIPAAPGTPGTPTVVVNSSGQATVSWTAPDGGGPINGYVVLSDPGLVAPAGCGDDIEARSCVFTGLDPATAYTFVVEAVGPAGFADSAASAPVVAGPPATPAAPTVTVGNAPRTLTVTWAVPAGGPVATYTLTSNQQVTVPNGCTGLQVRSCTFTDLDATLSYTFQVRATGPGGTAQSAPSAGVTPDQPGTPGTPVMTLGGTPGTATVTWDAPTTGGPVTGYTLTSNEPVTLPNGCTDVGVRSCALTGLDQTKSYTFTVTATGPAGSTQSATSAGLRPAAPGTPGTPVIALGVPGTATVTWDAPTTGGPVDSYTLASDQTVVLPNGCTAPGVRSCTLTGLDPTLPYAFRVTATGPSGAASSAWTAGVKPDRPGQPNAPNVTVGNVPRKATVTWDAPATGGPVTSYTLTSNHPVNLPAGCADPNVRSCVFTDLDPALSYTFQVTATGPAGTAASVASAGVTPDRPGAPGRPAVQNGAPGTVTVTWTAPEGGGPLTNYSVTSLPSVGPPNDCTATTQLSCVFTGLDPSETYAFVVTATGPAGTTPSPRSEQVTPGAPSAPGTPTAAVTGLNTVRVTWTASPATGGTVTGYTVTSDPAVPTPPECTLVNALTCDFTGLDASRPYTFLVTAIGPAGRTPSVARSAPVVAAPAGVPGTPTVRLTAAGTVRVTWTAPTGGGAVSGYTVTSDQGAVTPQACTNVQALSCDFSGLDPALPYTFLVTANGPAGNTPSAARSAAIRPDAPGAMAAPTVTLGGPNAVRVTWTAPAGGGPVTGYTVTSDPESSTPAACTDVLVLSCTFSGLTSGLPYRFRVVANGQVGAAVTSAPSAEITTGPPGTPGRPTVVLTDIPNQARVSWTASGEGAGIAGYTVRSTPGGHGCAVAAGATDTSCLVTGLQAGTAYTFRVQAVGVPNSGVSGFSAASAAVVAGSLNPPTDVDVAGADRQIAVSWTAPAGAGQRVAYYRATASPGGATCRTPDSTVTDCVITGLTNLTAYTVTVVAVGVAGTGDSAASAPSARVRPTAGPPGAPTGVRAVARNQGAQVSWTAPAAVGNGIARYVATAAGAQGEQSCATPNADTLTCLIPGLVNGVEYSVTVVAVGRAASGNSAPSAPPVTVAVSNAPAAPTNVTVGVGASSLTVAFTPGSGGDAVASHTATAVGGPSAGPCTTSGPTATTCVITGVTPGTTYRVTVVANGVTPGSQSAPSAASSPVTAIAWPAPALPTAVPVSSGALSSSAGLTLAVGATTTVSGIGFAPFTGITVGLYPGGTVLATAVTDSSGAFSVPVTISGVAPGSYTLVGGGMRFTGDVRFRLAPITVTGTATPAAMLP